MALGVIGVRDLVHLAIVIIVARRRSCTTPRVSNDQGRLKTSRWSDEGRGGQTYLCPVLCSRILARPVGRESEGGRGRPHASGITGFSTISGSRGHA
jgi:hypothetical protein